MNGFLRTTIMMLVAAMVGGAGALLYYWVNTDPLDGAATTTIVFVPPASGAPSDRVGAGTREVFAKPGTVQLLIPKGGGISISEHPALLWSLAAPHKGAMRAELKPANGGPLLAKIELDGEIAPGLYTLDLASENVRLEAGQVYELSVVLTGETASEIVEQSRGLVERVTGEPAKTAAEAASQGAWFDALGFLVESSSDGEIRIQDQGQFTQLLQSAGLKAETSAQ
ncbi:DUF928 domain-containing protein [Roseibium sp. MMSF_3544]|uniref:DUF928 domain-containing protein n=1 Tax=unclassified Roseibium TaxID=2629323 RepID=UPI00273F3009|nr:DUF928 domain-containing protein [Roseibium sp. MMSF_3544]